MFEGSSSKEANSFLAGDEVLAIGFSADVVDRRLYVATTGSNKVQVLGLPSSQLLIKLIVCSGVIYAKTD